MAASPSRPVGGVCERRRGGGHRVVQAFEFGVGHRRANNGNASGMWCEPRDGIERHAVIGDVRDWGHDDIPRGPNPSLK